MDRVVGYDIQNFFKMFHRTPKEVAAIDQAHDSIVWALAWHPLGHILCSGSNDHSCKFWTRNHPGDPMRDKYNLNTASASILGFEECEDGKQRLRYVYLSENM